MRPEKAEISADAYSVVGRRASQHVKPEMLEPELEAFLTEAFQKHFLLKSVPENEYKALSLSMKVKHAVPEEVIVRQGETAESVYFIRRGKFSLVQDDQALSHSLGPGDSFGELALLYSVPSSTTIIANEAGELWKMERQRFLECKEKLSSSQIEKALEFFQACQDFRCLKEDDQKSLAAVCTSKTFEDGAIVLRDEEIGECMYIVLSGQVAAGETEIFDRGSYGKPGSVIGSVGVMYNKQVPGSFAKGPVECLRLNKASLSGFSAAVIDVLRRAAFKAILHSLPRNPLDPEPWRILSERQVNLLISRAEDGVFEPGEIVFAPDDAAQLVIVVSGQVAVTKQPVRTREQGELVFIDEDADINQYSEQVIPSGHCYGKQPEFLEGVSMSTFGIALGRVRLHRILHSNVQELLGDSLMEVMRCAEIKRVLSDIFLFKNLNEVSQAAAAQAPTGALLVEVQDFSDFDAFKRWVAEQGYTQSTSPLCLLGQRCLGGYAELRGWLADFMNEGLEPRIAVLSLKKHLRGRWLTDLRLALAMQGEGTAVFCIEATEGTCIWRSLTDSPKWKALINCVSDTAPAHVQRRLVAAMQEADARGVFVSNGVHSFHACAGKVAQHALLRRLRLPSPNSITVSEASGEALARAAASCLRYPLLLKPNAGGFGNGIQTFAGEEELIGRDEASLQPAFGEDGLAILQEHLSPAGGSVGRIWMLGGEVLCAVRAPAMALGAAPGASSGPSGCMADGRAARAAAAWRVPEGLQQDARRIVAAAQ
ncbi:unnamed protein product, partial [Effrenium voratum]